MSNSCLLGQNPVYICITALSYEMTMATEQKVENVKFAASGWEVAPRAWQFAGHAPGLQAPHEAV